MSQVEIFSTLFKGFWLGLKPCVPYIIILIVIYIIVVFFKNNKNANTDKKTNKQRDKQQQISDKEGKEYKETEYYKETHTSYEDMITDKGKAGEYAAYRNICNISGYKKFLFNVYIENKDNADRKTEIDIILIHETGIFVIESKNFKGWIYGDEASEKWCQVFKNGKKFFFYNPIKQNYRHIQYLRDIVGDDKEITSIITFSDDATLKKITNTNENLKVINNKQLKWTLEDKIRSNESKLTQEQINEIYNKLKKKQW